MTAAHNFTGQHPVEMNHSVQRPLPQFPELRVEAVQPLDYREGPEPDIGYIATSLVHMTSGARYAVRDIRPVREYDASVAMTTPLGTRVKGHNTYIGTRFAQAAGTRTRILGCNQAAGYRTTAAEDAYSYDLILNSLDAEEGLYPGERSIINYGQSRGGMDGLGMLAYAAQLGIKMPLGIHVDSCLPEETTVAMTIDGLPAQNIVQEIGVTAQLLLRQPNERLREYRNRLQALPGTIGFSRQYLQAQINSGLGLWKGEAGVFAANLDPDQALIAHFFNRNRLNGRDTYVACLSQCHDGFRAVDEDRWHMDLGRPEVTEGSATKLLVVQQNLQQGVAPVSIVNMLTAPFFPK